jgi:enamine deaminase RidA (YjgF/YER057c/UK114 family)
MAGKIETRLAELGIVLPPAAAAAGNYVPFVVSGNTVFLAGQLPFKDGKLATLGRLGDTVSIEDGYQAARLCAINIIAQIKAAAGGDLDRVTRIIRLGGFVAGTAEFTDQPKVVNGASDLIVEVFGDIGRHARTAVGAPSLPLNVPVEIDAIVELSA